MRNWSAVAEITGSLAPKEQLILALKRPLQTCFWPFSSFSFLPAWQAKFTADTPIIRSFLFPSSLDIDCIDWLLRGVAMSRRLMLSLIAALAVFSALWLAVNIDRESHPGAKRIDISDIYRMRYADQNLSREDQINSANQLLSIRASAQKDGWTKFESADGRAIAQARVCHGLLR